MLFERKIYRFFGVLIFFILTTIQCKEKIEYTDDSYYGKVMILGHRGMGSLYKMPGNTYEAIAPVIAIGADGSEVDVQMTKDSVLVLYHDGTLNARTTCTGTIYESTWDEIKQCKYYAIQNNIFVNSVDTLFSQLPDLDQYYFSFDCKIDTSAADDDLYMEQFLRAIRRICEKYNMSDNVFLEGSETFLTKAQNLGLTNKLFLLSHVNESGIETASNSHFFGISTSIDWFDVDADKTHEKGLYIMAWSPDSDWQNKDALNKKADIIQTDDPMTILKLLNRFNYEYVIP